MDPEEAKKRLRLLEANVAELKRRFDPGLYNSIRHEMHQLVPRITIQDPVLCRDYEVLKNRAENAIGEENRECVLALLDIGMRVLRDHLDTGLSVTPPGTTLTCIGRRSLLDFMEG